MKKILALMCFALAIAGCSEPSNLDANGNYVKGVHYRELANPIPASSNDITVTEFFGYGCPHCELFEKPLHKWEETLSDSVVLVQSPAVWNEAMKLHAKVFFITQQLENSKQIHGALFNEIIGLREVSSLSEQQAKLAAFLSDYGLSEQEFNALLNSADIVSKLKQAMLLMSSAEIQGTPTLLVNGRYIILNESASSVEQVMDIASYLVELEKTRLSNP
ncbi:MULTISPECIES: thiol:disulfide interchange protein DsbA/DsbL [unclassified Shewanella]|uniref:thiol:disulfide interchange protein DsbA/DsbL n=1 Tax=unclassified Shewanella TaxID=196818 RepID=UPI001BB8F168|nr:MULTISPECIES: thiol:disulfide interchange protein DsbA/DsbL [unclassified Shewanella]GIU16480.1 thiol:disulfide interchange protein DsbA [Shewanella sp. MBTL60-112-B1]GIU36888.1 thiol:disulfide interchange protein DsbA [Shewanella sp. MBTL60-112-B2]